MNSVRRLTSSSGQTREVFRSADQNRLHILIIFISKIEIFSMYKKSAAWFVYFFRLSRITGEARKMVWSCDSGRLRFVGTSFHCQSKGIIAASKEWRKNSHNVT